MQKLLIISCFCKFKKEINMKEIKKVFSYVHEYKGKVYVSSILATISVIAGIMPYFFVHKIIMSFLGDISVTVNYILLMSVSILVCLIAKALLFYKATTAAHEAAYDTLMGMQNKLADKIIKIVTEYFLTQRIKPVDPKNKHDYDHYIKRVTLLHQIMVFSMKCKQTTDLEHCKKLRSLLKSFENDYAHRH